MSKKTRRYIQEATAAKQNKRKATAAFADMALISKEQSTHEDDGFLSSAKFFSTNIVPPVVKANELPKGILNGVADKDPTSAKAEPKRKATVSTKKDPAKSAPLIEAGFRFGRCGHSSVKMQRTSRVSELRLSSEVTHRIRANSRVKSPETGEM